MAYGREREFGVRPIARASASETETARTEASGEGSSTYHGPRLNGILSSPSEQAGCCPREELRKQRKICDCILDEVNRAIEAVHIIVNVEIQRQEERDRARECYRLWTQRVRDDIIREVEENKQKMFARSLAIGREGAKWARGVVGCMVAEREQHYNSIRPRFPGDQIELFSIAMAVLSDEFQEKAEQVRQGKAIPSLEDLRRQGVQYWDDADFEAKKVGDARTFSLYLEFRRVAKVAHQLSRADTQTVIEHNLHNRPWCPLLCNFEESVKLS